ncbi:hypothetical protein [Oxynema aestuarii]|uniref:Uncharacterized protein n=1 Tax=Oxynema aestuarii AP17 TaxID=2064643 RepID=A0A6H1TYF6_9CYAN|nr:hypothetical protein [Oxynema aestuarii]QIZ70950.1 hypothetical protein HCG48_10415 [Oxynema aestuarii AP17]
MPRFVKGMPESDSGSRPLQTQAISKTMQNLLDFDLHLSLVSPSYSHEFTLLLGYLWAIAQLSKAEPRCCLSTFDRSAPSRRI